MGTPEGQRQGPGAQIWMETLGCRLGPSSGLTCCVARSNSLSLWALASTHASKGSQPARLVGGSDSPGCGQDCSRRPLPAPTLPSSCLLRPLCGPAPPSDPCGVSFPPWVWPRGPSGDPAGPSHAPPPPASSSLSDRAPLAPVPPVVPCHHLHLWAQELPGQGTPTSSVALGPQLGVRGPGRARRRGLQGGRGGFRKVANAYIVASQSRVSLGPHATWSTLGEAETLVGMERGSHSRDTGGHSPGSQPHSVQGPGMAPAHEDRGGGWGARWRASTAPLPSTGPPLLLLAPEGHHGHLLHSQNFHKPLKQGCY